MSAVCHGPAALVLAKKQGTEKSILSGIEVTGFSNSEEAQTPYNDFVNILPFSLEDKIQQLGGKYVKADDWQEKIVWDGGVLTGKQNRVLADSRPEPCQRGRRGPQAQGNLGGLIQSRTRYAVCIHRGMAWLSHFIVVPPLYREHDLRIPATTAGASTTTRRRIRTPRPAHPAVLVDFNEPR